MNKTDETLGRGMFLYWSNKKNRPSIGCSNAHVWEEIADFRATAEKQELVEYTTLTRKMLKRDKHNGKTSL